ncbi:MAG: DNA primase catalytic subunit PriS [Thermoplasmata archaeon]
MKGGEDPKKSLDFVRSRFRDYYKECKLYLPDRHSRREFGFMFFDSDFVQRHTSFESKNELKQFLVDRVPAHVYHSAAYYEKPDAPTMAQKNWLGSDLIFDLDADHIVHAKKMGYEAMLERVKEETKKLVDNFLVQDFGFGEKELILAFSGGRGYHVHIRDPRIWNLTSHERREIVDYILGTGMDEDAVFTRRPYDRTPFEVKYRFEMPSTAEGGWRGRIAKGIIEEVQLLKRMKRSDAISRLKEMKGVGESTANEIYSILFEGEKGRTGYDNLMKGKIEIFPKDRYLSRFRKGFLNRARESKSGKTDEPVTSDIKRLIRLPSSLHGKTGLRVVLLTRSQLDDFNPLLQAIPSTWSSEPVKVKGKTRAKLELKGETFNLREDIVRLPEYAAIFFICRGMATLA